MRKFPFLGALLLIAVWSGCAYRLGPTNGTAAGSRSVQVAPFTDKTLEPRLNDAVATALRRAIQDDATFHLATHGDPDVVISGVLLQYNRHELALVPTDVLTVQDYRISVKAQVTARERVSGKVLFDQPVTGYTIIPVGSDLTSAERQAMPLLADDLARNINELLSDGIW
ncbi:MAG: LPS assembly lipoprotein LptE [Verrucomicrobiota bacterium]